MTVATWLVLVLVALSVGVSKSALPGLSTLGVALVATVLPAKESTGLLLLLLLTGDLVAVSTYWRQADWRLLSRLMLPVVVGVLSGVLFLTRVDDLVMRRTIGLVLLALLAVRGARVLVDRRARTREASAEGRLLAAGQASGEVVAARRGAPPAPGVRNRAVGLVYGALAGFTTMVANAGGPVMSLYLLSVGATKLRFLGTAACFFFAVNLFKLPFSIGLSLIDLGTLRTAAVLVPVVLLGAWLGRSLVRRIDQQLFERLVVAVTLVGSLYLLR